MKLTPWDSYAEGSLACRWGDHTDCTKDSCKCDCHLKAKEVCGAPTPDKNKTPMVEKNVQHGEKRNPDSV